MKVAIDFDGTVVDHQYPEIGKSIGAEKVLKYLIDNGHKIILNTMRSGLLLKASVDWFKERDIELYGINKDPKQNTWTDSPKVYADLYIDDRSLGAPIINNHLDWFETMKKLYQLGLITKTQVESLLDDDSWIMQTERHG